MSDSSNHWEAGFQVSGSGSSRIGGVGSSVTMIAIAGLEVALAG